MIGDELEAWLPARNRRKTAKGSVSLILVDRSVDLAGTVIEHGESVLGRMLESHEKIGGHTVGALEFKKNAYLSIICDV